MVCRPALSVDTLSMTAVKSLDNIRIGSRTAKPQCENHIVRVDSNSRTGSVEKTVVRDGADCH
jgi:hypothetical protein